MKLRRLLWSAFGAVALLDAIGGAWIFSLPPTPSVAAPPPIAQEERDATIAALKPPKRQRPLIAIIGINDATETTDYLMPYGILRRADVADVVALATEPGPVTLFPALKVEPQATIAEFDARHPDGADYVIVPAMSRDDDPAALQWIRSQAAKGAIVIGVCAGAKVVGDSRAARRQAGDDALVFSRSCARSIPTIRYVADRRLVVDRGVATTTGITASMPMSLTLIEAIAGRDKARGRRPGSRPRRLGRAARQRCVQVHAPVRADGDRQHAAFWNREQLGIELDARRRRSVARAGRGCVVADLSLARGDIRRHAGARQTRNGIRILPDRGRGSWPAERRLPAIGDQQPAHALDQALGAIAARYGTRTTDFVAMQLEYPRHRATR